MPDTDDKPTLYAQFDGDEYAGRTYALGEPIDLDQLDHGTRTMLEASGRIGSVQPEATRVDTTRDVNSMSRAQLLTELAAGRSDEELREHVRDRRKNDAAQVDGDEDKGDKRLKASIPKIKEALATETNLDTLKALRDEETKGDHRGGALEVINARIAEVEAGSA